MMVAPFQIPDHGVNLMPMPSGAEPLKVAVINGNVTMFTRVNERNPIVNRKIYCVFSGNQFELGYADAKYIDTFVVTVAKDGKQVTLIVHVFDGGEEGIKSPILVGP